MYCSFWSSKAFLISSSVGSLIPGGEVALRQADHAGVRLGVILFVGEACILRADRHRRFHDLERSLPNCRSLSHQVVHLVRAEAARGQLVARTNWSRVLGR